MRRASVWIVCLTAGLLSLPAAAQETVDTPPAITPPSPTMVSYKPPVKSRPLDGTEEPRPLLAALQQTGDQLLSQEWNRRTSREMGTALLTEDYAPFYEKERIARLARDFREGYMQVFLQLPQVVYLSAAEMASEESAADFYRVNIEVLQMQLDGTNESEEGRVEFVREGEVTLAGLDEAYEKRYDLLVGDLPPSRFLVLFGRADRYMVTVTFLQSDLGEVTARNLLGSLAARLRDLGAGE